MPHVIYQATNTLEAHLLKGLLAAEGIEAIILGEALQGGAGELPVFGVVRLAVAAEDVGRARELVRDYEAGRLELPGSRDSFLA